MLIRLTFTPPENPDPVTTNDSFDAQAELATALETAVAVGVVTPKTQDFICMPTPHVETTVVDVVELVVVVGETGVQSDDNPEVGKSL